jgi:hypothetical protein
MRQGESTMTDIPFAPELLQWRLADFSGSLRSTNKYVGGQGASLFCKVNSRYLTFVDETGVNAGFKSNGDRKTHFRLPDGQEREIRTGDVIAFGIGGDPSFLYYRSQPIGINLDYSSKPVFQWTIMDASGEAGRPITAGIDIALANNNVDIGGSKATDFLVYLERPGGDIGWTTSPPWTSTILGLAKDAGRVIAEKAVQAAIASL